MPDEMPGSALRNRTRGHWRGYAVGLALTLLALVVRMGLAHVLGPTSHPFAVLFCVASIAAAWYGGLLAGVFSAILGTALLAYYFVEPKNSLAVARIDDSMLLFTYFISSLLGSWLCENLHNTRRRLIAATNHERLWRTRYEAAIEPSGSVLYEYDFDSKRTIFGGKTKWMLGIQADQMPMDRDGYLSLIHPEDRARFHLESTESEVSGRPFSIEYRLRRSDDTWITVLDNGRFLSQNEGKSAKIVGLIKDISAAVETKERLKASESEYRSLFEGSGVGNAEVELLTGRLLRVNEKFCEMVGYSSVEFLQGMTLLQLTHPDDSKSHVEPMSSFLDGRLPRFDIERRLVRKDGGTLWVHITGTLLGTGDGRANRLLASTIDITARKEADRKKDEFLAILAHELRNPLAPLRNGLQIMKISGSNLDALQQAREMMERQIVQMTRLIDDLMDLSRISGGKIVLQKSKLLLADAVQVAIDTSRPLMQQYGHHFTLEMPSEPIYVDGDSIRLSQVFSNLLNNSAKYTDPGGQIRFCIERQGSDVVATVHDNGIGIPVHMLDHVFEMFSQVDHSLERSQGGLGIGLNIVKKLVEKHGGTIEAHSQGEGCGSQFVVRLPVLISPHSPSQNLVDDPVADLNRSIRVLIVDDNQDGASSLAMMLEIYGIITEVAHDGLDAIAKAESFHPEIILMDIGMPKLNGFEACRKIRQQTWGRELLIIAQTGWGQSEDIEEAISAGFDLHLTKPIAPGAILQILQHRGGSASVDVANGKWSWSGAL